MAYAISCLWFVIVAVVTIAVFALFAEFYVKMRLAKGTSAYVLIHVAAVVYVAGIAGSGSSSGKPLVLQCTALVLTYIVVLSLRRGGISVCCCIATAELSLSRVHFLCVGNYFMFTSCV